MNDFIVDPMFFYWLNVVGGIKMFFIFSAFIFSIGIVIYITGIYTCKSEEEYQRYVNNKKIHYKDLLHKNYQKHIIILTIISAFFVFSAILMPTKETLIQMKVAEQVTYSNIDKAEIKIKECVDYIFKKVKEL